MNSETHSTSSGQARVCQNCKQNFTIEPDDFQFYEKINVPPPTFCWQCRFQRRLVWRNERKPFWNISAKSGKKFLSAYPPEAGLTVYDEKEWRGGRLGWYELWSRL